MPRYSHLVLCALFALPLGAQTVTGSLVGHVVDASAAAVPEVKVVAVEVNRGTFRTAVTNESGSYVISSMDPGIYKVTIEQPGFKTFVKDSVEIAIDSTVRVDAQLQLGAVNESVEVKANVLEIQTDRGDIIQRVDSHQVENLPLSLDRNYQSLMEMIPGSTAPATIGSNFGNPSGSLAMYVNGQNNRYNSFQLDGTINNETNVTAQSAIVPPPEAIQVMDVSTNAYDVEAGRATGAALNVQIKSGTNSLHGSLWGYNSNSAFTARNPLSVTPPVATKLTQAGFTVGGPIRRNKTFFFGDFQLGRSRQAENSLLSVPAVPFRSGDFSAAHYGIYDPLTGATDGSGRTLFPGNIIPTSRISPVARNILNLWALPDLPGLTSNYAASGSMMQDRNGTDVKVNHKFTDMTTAFVRYSYFGADTHDPAVFGDLGGPTAANGATAALGPSRTQSSSANLTHIFSSTLVSEFRAGVVRFLIEGGISGDPNVAAKLGIPNVNDGDFFSPGMPGVTISGYSSLGYAITIPFKIAETSSNLVSNWTKQHGNHSVHWGADFRDLILNNHQAGGSDPRGIYAFTASITGAKGTSTDSTNALAGFMLGLPATMSRTNVTQQGGYRMQQYYMYVQDRWQVSSKLTINYGLRYEVTPFPTGANPGNESSYDPGTDKVMVAGYGPVNSRLNINTNYHEFAPRLGLAYRIAPKTVIRAGYGISYVPLGVNQLSPTNYPSQITMQLAGANSLQPAGNIASGIAPPQPIDVSAGLVSNVPTTTSLAVFNGKARRGYAQDFNITAEREFAGFVASASYVGNLGTRLPGTLDINAAPPGSTAAQRPLAIAYGRTAEIYLYDYLLSSSYNGLQTRVERRFSRIGSLTLAYTYSKSLDYTDAFTVATPLDTDTSRGPSTFDRTHNLVITHVVPLPFGRDGLFFKTGLMAQVLGGWRFSGMFSARTGDPLTVTGVKSASNAGVGFTNKPNLTGPITILGGEGPGQLWFSTSEFTDPAQGMVGNAGRNIIRGPGYVNENLTFSRIFAIRERFRLNAMASAFNLTNSTHFGDPTVSLTSGNFGQITSASGQRQLRIGLRVEF